MASLAAAAHDWAFTFDRPQIASPVAAHMEKREVFDDGVSDIYGPNSDRERCFSACCALCLGGPYFPVVTIPFREFARWHGCLDFSTPVDFATRRSDGVLIVRTRSRVCCWKVDEIPLAEIQSFAIYSETTKWVSSNDRYVLEFSAPVRATDGTSLRRAMPRAHGDPCSDDQGCDRCMEACLNSCTKPAGTPLIERPYFPSAFLGAAVRGRSEVTRMSRRRWLPHDVDAMALLVAKLSQLLPEADEESEASSSSDGGSLHGAVIPRTSSETLLCDRGGSKIVPIIAPNVP